MADIAGIFHWPLSEMDRLDVIDLLAWHRRAIDFWERTHPKAKK